MKSWIFFWVSLMLAAAMACMGASPGDDVSPASPEGADSNGLGGIEWPVSFRVARVLEYDQGEGEPPTTSSIEDRFMTSTFEFNADGTFVYDTARGISTLYPVSGNYRVENDGILFSGSKNHSYGSAGDASVDVEGEVDISATDGPVARVTVTEKINASTSDYGSVRSTNKTSVYSGSLLLEPVE